MHDARELWGLKCGALLLWWLLVTFMDIWELLWLAELLPLTPSDLQNAPKCSVYFKGVLERKK